MVKRAAGFTLVELIMVIAVAGVVATMVSTIIGQQAYGYVQFQKRAQLVQQAEAAMQLMSLDIQNAVPNSIRVNGSYLELVPIDSMAYYRRTVDYGSGTGDELDFSVADDQFEVFSDLVSADTFSATAQVVIYNLGLTGTNLYVDEIDPTAVLPADQVGVISEPGLYFIDQANGSGYPEDIICFDQNNTNCGTPVGQQFTSPSPSQRLYVVDGALTYYCNANASNPAAGTLERYSDYAIQSSQPSSTGAAPLSSATSAVVTDGVSSCSIQYSSGSMARDSLISIRLTLSNGQQMVTLLKQIKVSNVP